MKKMKKSNVVRLCKPLSEHSNDVEGFAYKIYENLDSLASDIMLVRAAPGMSIDKLCLLADELSGDMLAYNFSGEDSTILIFDSDITYRKFIDVVAHLDSNKDIEDIIMQDFSYLVTILKNLLGTNKMNMISDEIENRLFRDIKK